MRGATFTSKSIEKRPFTKASTRGSKARSEVPARSGKDRCLNLFLSRTVRYIYPTQWIAQRLGKVNRVLTAKAQSGRVACSGETIERLKENRYERMGCVLVRLAFAPAHDTSHVLLDAKFVVVARKLFRRTESKEDETTKGEHRRRGCWRHPAPVESDTNLQRVFIEQK